MSTPVVLPCPCSGCGYALLVIDHQVENVTEVFLTWHAGAWGEPLDLEQGCGEEKCGLMEAVWN